MVFGCGYTTGGQSLKDLGKFIHYHVPLFLVSNILIGSPNSSSLFSSPMGGHWDFGGWSCKGSTSSVPNSLYRDLIGDMQGKIEKEKTTLIPLI